LILKYLKFDDIEIIDYDTNEISSNDICYILLKDDHYYVVEKFEENNRKDIRTLKGLLTFDFETRQTDKFHYIKAKS
jgi:hypothetical protein